MQGHGQLVIDLELAGFGAFPLELDRYLGAAAGDRSQHGLADAALQLTELSGQLDDYLRLLAVDGRDFDGRKHPLVLARAAAKSGHRLHS